MSVCCKIWQYNDWTVSSCVVVVFVLSRINLCGFVILCWIVLILYLVPSQVLACNLYSTRFSLVSSISFVITSTILALFAKLVHFVYNAFIDVIICKMICPSLLIFALLWDQRVHLTLLWWTCQWQVCVCVVDFTSTSRWSAFANATFSNPADVAIASISI